MSSIPAMRCQHSNHAFDSILCDNQTLLRKIANVVFHILTLGIPLALYHLGRWLFSHQIIKNEVDVFSRTLLSSNGREALAFAKQKLAENSKVEPTKFMGQPINPDIARLVTIYDENQRLFCVLLRKHPEDNPWADHKVISSADALMKLSFAISALTLEDLARSIRKSTHTPRTNAEFLTFQWSYQYRTFYFCTNVYHWCRGALRWEPVRRVYCFHRDPRTDADCTPPSHAGPFYQEGTVQHSWRALYNEYCALVRRYVDEAELRRADQRHVLWTMQDTRVELFEHTPTTQPT